MSGNADHGGHQQYKRRRFRNWLLQKVDTGKRAANGDEGALPLAKIIEVHDVVASQIALRAHRYRFSEVGADGLKIVGQVDVPVAVHISQAADRSAASYVGKGCADAQFIKETLGIRQSAAGRTRAQREAVKCKIVAGRRRADEFGGRVRLVRLAGGNVVI